MFYLTFADRYALKAWKGGETMRRDDIINFLIDSFGEDPAELEKMTKKQLERLLAKKTGEHTDGEYDMYPNGRDYDAENEDILGESHDDDD